MENLNIVFLTSDWNDLFLKGFSILKDKLSCYRLEPGRNNILYVDLSDNKTSVVRSEDGKYARSTIPAYSRLKPLCDMQMAFGACSAVERAAFSPDLAICVDVGYLFAALRLRKRFGCKVAYLLTNMPKVYSRARRFGYFKALYTGYVERHLMKQADYVLPINASLQDYALELGVPKEKIQIISPNTIARDQKHIEESHSGQIRKKLGLSEDQRILLTVARLDDEKDHSRLIRLFAKLPGNDVLVCVGVGPLEGMLRDLAKDLGVADRVFFEGYVTRDNIWNYFKDADIFILLSTAEALGLVFWEAMYVGVPVIGSTASGIAETIGEGNIRGRILADNATTEEELEAVAFCLTPSDKREQMLGRAEQIVHEQLSKERNINDIVGKI